MSEYHAAPHQVAGHDGVLVDESGLLFIKPSTQQEIDFYTKLNSEEYQEEDDNLKDWTPNFLGILETGISEKAKESQDISDEVRQLDAKTKKTDQKPYIVLENLLFGFKNPSIIDIKLGSILTDDGAPDEKKMRLAQVSKDTTSGSHHFRVCGMKLFADETPDLSMFGENVKEHVKPDSDGYLNFNKWYGRAITAQTLHHHFKIFFTHNKLSEEQQQIIIRNTFTRLQLLFNCLVSSDVRMRSASLLIAYENSIDRWSTLDHDDPIYRDQGIHEDEDASDDDEINNSSLSFLSLIDFAHSEFTPGKGVDEDTIRGVQNLIDSVDKLILE